MKATIKDTLSAVVIGINLLALPLAAQAAPDEHQRYLIQKAMKAKQEAKKEQASMEQAKDKECDEPSKASHAGDKHDSHN